MFEAKSLKETELWSARRAIEGFIYFNEPIKDPDGRLAKARFEFEGRVAHADAIIGFMALEGCTFERALQEAAQRAR